MTINVLWIILAVSIGTGQSITGSDATAEPNSLPETGCYVNGTWTDPCQETNCYVNGIWINPCPNPESAPPRINPEPNHQ